MLIIERLQNLRSQENKKSEFSAKHFVWFDECLQTLKSQLVQMFEQFTKNQVDILNSTKITAKRSGVLSPLKRILNLVYQIDVILKNSNLNSKLKYANNATLETYTIVNKNIGKLLYSLSSWIETISMSDEKYTNLVLMENNFYLYKIIENHFNNVSVEIINFMQQKFVQPISRPYFNMQTGICNMRSRSSSHF